MRILYDTSRVHPLDRFDYYRSKALGEFAPVAVGGQRPGQLSTAMVVDQVGDLTVEVVRWASDTPFAARRPPRLVRAADPECFRLVVNVNGGLGTEQRDNLVNFRTGDIALFDTSRPHVSWHLPTSSVPSWSVMATFPHTVLVGADRRIERYVGTVFPRAVRGRTLLADLLTGLIQSPCGLVEEGDLENVAEVLWDGVIGLLRERLGLRGMTTDTCRRIQLARIRGVIRRQWGRPDLGPARIARSVGVSPRYLYEILHGAGTTPMALVKQLRLEECRRKLTDPALAHRSIKEIARSMGYPRPDQFAHDFKQMFGVAAGSVRPRPGPAATAGASAAGTR
jgi:AraC-like DNA-binding protein